MKTLDDMVVAEYWSIFLSGGRNAGLGVVGAYTYLPTPKTLFGLAFKLMESCGPMLFFQPTLARANCVVDSFDDMLVRILR